MRAQEKGRTADALAGELRDLTSSYEATVRTLPSVLSICIWCKHACGRFHRDAARKKLVLDCRSGTARKCCPS